MKKIESFNLGKSDYQHMLKNNSEYELGQYLEIRLNILITEQNIEEYKKGWKIMCEKH